MGITKSFTINNEAGLHARPAAVFVKTANQFSSDIWVSKDGEEVNGKSILGLMMLAAEHGSTIEISVEGEDAEKAMEAISSLIMSDFASP
ncbi:MAG: HPr family phosphocarrier protein [Verrucomicrobiota bacterium]